MTDEALIPFAVFLLLVGFIFGLTFLKLVGGLSESVKIVSKEKSYCVYEDKNRRRFTRSRCYGEVGETITFRWWNC